jgi:hypothetical protein
VWELEFSASGGILVTRTKNGSGNPIPEPTLKSVFGSAHMGDFLKFEFPYLSTT